MAKTEIIGSWFPSGYHGHYRSKTRLDFMNEFRHISKPQPPKTFIYRIKNSRADHPFSKHDNREVFMNDALIFEQGLGRRRFSTSINRGQKDFLAWTPHKADFDKTGPKISTYRVDYQPSPSVPFKQKFVSRPKTSFDEGGPVTTTYRYTHGKDNPNKDLLTAINNGLACKPQPPPSFRKLRTKSAPESLLRESVASCMTWHTATPRLLHRNQTTIELTAPSVPQTAPPAMDMAPPSE